MGMDERTEDETAATNASPPPDAMSENGSAQPSSQPRRQGSIKPEVITLIQVFFAQFYFILWDIFSNCCISLTEKVVKYCKSFQITYCIDNMLCLL